MVSGVLWEAPGRQKFGQEHPKSANRVPRTPPERPRSAQGHAQGGQRVPQEWPKSAQEPPRATQECSRAAPKVPKTAQKRAQEQSKSAQERPKNDPKAPYVEAYAKANIFAQNLISFWCSVLYVINL